MNWLIFILFLYANITENEINLQSLSALTTDDIKEIIPQLGPRALFLRCWKAWATDFSSANQGSTSNQCTSLDSSNQLTDLTNISFTDLPVLIEDYLPTSGTSPITFEKTQQTSPTKLAPVNLEDNVLFKLLQNNFESSSLLRFVGKSLDNENARNLLASTITKEILKENKNSPITSNVYNSWIKNIKVLFPEERITTYYIPPCVTAQGITHQARGKLVSQLMNTRRKYQKLGVLDSKERKLQVRSIGSQQSSSSPRPFPSLTINTTQNTNNAEEDLTWLKSSSEPWDLVQSKWKATLSERFRDLRKPVYSIEQYFDDYPALQKPQGYKLLVDDFNESYPNYANNFYLNFPSIKSKLIELVSRKATKNDIYLNDLINLAKDTNEEHRNLAAILSLPGLISPSVVALPCQSTSSSSINPPSAKRKKGKDKRWKPTKAESREAFVTHVHDDSYIKIVINKRHQNITEKGFTPQPYIAMVGANLYNIKSYFIVVNPNIFYDCPNILAAIDSCFKITWALNLEYSPSTYGSWFFLQKGLYKLDSPFDKGSTSVESSRS